MTAMTKAELIKKAMRLESELSQLNEQIGLMPDEPERWKPPAGQHWFGVGGVVSSPTNLSDSRALKGGFVSSNERQSDAKYRATVARNILQTWVDEEGEAGEWIVCPDGEGAWASLQLNAALATPWDILMSESTANRAADLLTRGVIKLEVEND